MADANDAAAPGTPTDITQPGSSTPVVTSAGSITTAAPPADETRITLPPRPPRQPAAPEVFQRRLAVLDNFVLLPLLLVFAFFMAAKPVRNSDLEMHLATGRAFVEGRYNPFTGQDPFAHTTAGVRWVNHSWLYDVLVYELYRVAGIVGLNVIKCLAIVVLALVLVRVGRSGHGLATPILCTALALLAMRPRMLLQPVVIVSFLFLGLTLWLLQRGGRWLYDPRAEEGPAGRKQAAGTPVTWKNYWPLLPLFALWVNLDEWFFLGPLTVGLYALGQFIQAKLTERRVTATTPRPGEVRALGLLFVLGLLACLINPQHVLALRLPAQLGFSEVASTLHDDSYLRPLFFSPFNAAFFSADNRSIAFFAYFPLALLGLASFAFEYSNLRWARVLPFGFFLALSLWHQRAVPFFAVVAAPVMALNFQDALRRLRTAPADYRLALARQRGLTTGRVAAALLLLLTLVAAWPGYLEARPTTSQLADYRVALVDEIDPSLRQAALWLKEQREQGTLPADALAFNTSPEIANALAWYCPEEKVFFDFRIDLFAAAAGDYVKVRRALEGPAPRSGEQEDWQAILRERKVDHLVLYSRRAEVLQTPLLRLARSGDWVEMYNDGRTVVFGWAKERPAYRSQRLDPVTQAYAPAEGQRAPAAGMTRLPGVRPFWEDFTRPLPPRSLGTDEALMQLSHFDAASPVYARRNRSAWQLALACGAIGGGTPAWGPAERWLGPLYLSQSFDELLRWESQTGSARKRPSAAQANRFGLVAFLYRGRQENEMFLFGRDSGPPVRLLLAARAARRALAENPEDYQALARLGEAYFRQLRLTGERQLAQMLTWSDPQKSAGAGDGRPLAQLRHIQAVSALEQSLLLRPDQYLVHAQLAELYNKQGFPGEDGRWHRGFKDLELLHRKATLKHVRRGADESPAQFEQRTQLLRDQVEQLQKVVDRDLDGLENSRHRYRQVLAFAQRAWDLNLGGKALQILLDSNLAAFGAEGAQLQIMLALMTGRVREVRKWFEDGEGTDKGLDKVLMQQGPFTYPWWRAMLAVATGDYAEADKQLQAIAVQSSRPAMLAQIMRRQMEMGLTLRKPGLPPSVPEAFSLLIARSILDAPLPPSSWMTHTPSGKDERVGSLMQGYFMFSVFLIDEAQIHDLRGLLALEQGDTKRAAEACGKASALLRNLPRRLPARKLADDHLWEMGECWGLRPFGLAQN